MQFMLDCRPFYIAGFNAHDLIPKALATTSDHKTFGKQSAYEPSTILNLSGCLFSFSLLGQSLEKAYPLHQNFESFSLAFSTRSHLKCKAQVQALTSLVLTILVSILSTPCLTWNPDQEIGKERIW